jgi:hypothetical protein
MRFVRHQSAQSSPARRLQPAARALSLLGVAAAALAVSAGPMCAQQTVTIDRDDTTVLAEPGGVRLGLLAAGTTLRATGSRDGSTQIMLDGWIWAASLRPDRRGGHTLAVDKAPSERFRASANGPILGVLVSGALLDEVERDGGWVHVRRSAWVASRALRGAPAAPPGGVAGGAPARGARPAAAGADSVAAPADARLAIVRQRVGLRPAPDSAPSGTLEAETPVRIAERAGEWVRVEAEGWVRASDLRPAAGTALSNVTAAEIRSDPERYQGQLLRWTIEFIALQTADDLRPDFTAGERYILARGPAPEYAFVYVVVPPEKVAAVERLAPLSTVTVLARVRNARSTYLANPILDLVDIVP